jgi:hypothetical protein
MKGDEEKGWAAGCDHYVTKPYNPLQLLRTLRAFSATKDRNALSPIWGPLLPLPMAKLASGRTNAVNGVTPQQCAWTSIRRGFRHKPHREEGKYFVPGRDGWLASLIDQVLGHDTVWISHISCKEWRNVGVRRAVR